ncbi:MAG: phosphoribosyltransferase [Aulosira sp. ZfuVER01]|nr:phosphoribosyltransferase [Aulosira sp. ZfuVER01]MDZ8001905.1 phosphoribosyltransferase [Aulosira sp. DedVER01a]MDZ8055315.1 phosphoribosyltransferase [Aulosira sp. ZfuCHP01]
MTTRFRNRSEAGKQLASKLTDYAHRPDVLVLGLPRGGVPIAFEVAKALDVPWDICLVSKLTVPGHKELAMGAIASGGVRCLNYDVVSWLGISGKTIDDVAAKEQRELERHDRTYRGHLSPLDLREHTIILIDDGIATGSTMRAAIAIVREQQPQQIIVAVPVGLAKTCKELRQEVDKVVCLMTPEPFYAIALWYENFAQISDTAIHELLTQQFAVSC